MNLKVKNYIIWPLLIILAIGVGLYPLAYLFGDMSGGLLASKPQAVLENSLWNFGFYSHIMLGGLALIIGWLQFIEKLRKTRIDLHRKIGYTYVISVLLSGFAGLFISFYVTGAWHTKLGFFLLAVFWLWTTIMAVRAIREKNITSHQYWMMRSYALTLAAVTLRLWLPFFIGLLGWSFSESYKFAAWLCWLPNLFLMELYICQKTNSK